jgi:hypothetical protein
MPHAFERCYSRAHPYRCSNPWDTPQTTALRPVPLAARTPSTGAVDNKTVIRLSLPLRREKSILPSASLNPSPSITSGTQSGPMPAGNQNTNHEQEVYTSHIFSTVRETYIDFLDQCQLVGLDLGHQELHTSFAVLAQQTAGVLKHRGVALPSQGAEDDAEALGLPRLDYVSPVVSTQRNDASQKLRFYVTEHYHSASVCVRTHADRTTREQGRNRKQLTSGWP